jgi:peptidoglycan/LPS O-acetylase OafA/YrhL
MSHASVAVTGNTARTAPENRVVYPALDGLRAIAFLMVFGQHYLLAPWGWTGVNVFFVLSGFLITGILVDTRDAPHRARNFYVRRTLRIFPLYYGIALLFLITTPLVHWHWTTLWLPWLFYLGNFLRFLSPSSAVPGTRLELAADAHLSSTRLPRSEIYFGHFWSLCVEEQFYLFWPWIVFWVRSRRALIALCAAVVVLTPIARVVAAHFAPAWQMQQELTYRLTPFQLDSLLLGALVALLWRGSLRNLLIRAAAWISAACLLAAVLYLAFTIHAAHGFAGYVYPGWKQTWGLSFINIFSAAVIVCCLRPQTFAARLLSLRPLRWLGRISYGAYVFHDLFHGLYDHAVVHNHFALVRAHHHASLALVAFPATLLLSWLSFRFFESPFLNLKQRFTVPLPAGSHADSATQN